MLATTQQRRDVLLVVNQTRKPNDGRNVRNQLRHVLDRYVSPGLDKAVRLELLGDLPSDPAVRECVQRRQLLMQVLPGAPASVAMVAIATRMVGDGAGPGGA